MSQEKEESRPADPEVGRIAIMVFPHGDDRRLLPATYSADLVIVETDTGWATAKDRYGPVGPVDDVFDKVAACLRAMTDRQEGGTRA